MVPAAIAVSPWLDSLELGDYLRYTGTEAQRRDAAVKWARRHHVIPAHRGRRLLYSRRDVDQVLTHREKGRRAAA